MSCKHFVKLNCLIKECFQDLDSSKDQIKFSQEKKRSHICETKKKVLHKLVTGKERYVGALNL